MTTLRNHSFLLVLLALLSACTTSAPAPGTPGTPTPPQIKLANELKALTDGIGVAMTGMRQSRDAGSLSADTLVAVEQKAFKPALLLVKQINAILRDNPDWSKARLLALQAALNSGVGVGLSNAPEAARPYLQAASVAYSTITGILGAP